VRSEHKSPRGKGIDPPHSEYWALDAASSSISRLAHRATGAVTPARRPN
jgi:hypothetical protein